MLQTPNHLVCSDLMSTLIDVGYQFAQLSLLLNQGSVFVIRDINFFVYLSLCVSVF